MATDNNSYTTDNKTNENLEINLGNTVTIETIQEAYNFAVKNNYKIKDKQLLENIVNKCFTLNTDSKQCPINPETNTNFNKCFYYRSSGDYGDMCRKVTENYGTDNLNLMIQNKCNDLYSDKDMDDCNCVNRDFNTEYNILKKDFNSDLRNCWYKPCSSGKYLNTKDSKITCPSEIQNKINLFSIENPEINNIKTSSLLEAYVETEMDPTKNTIQEKQNNPNNNPTLFNPKPLQPKKPQKETTPQEKQNNPNNPNNNYNKPLIIVILCVIIIFILNSS